MTKELKIEYDKLLPGGDKLHLVAYRNVKGIWPIIKGVYTILAFDDMGYRARAAHIQIESTRTIIDHEKFRTGREALQEASRRIAV